ncbi:murein biosynthesis integral membrane protein MurJ, partial [Vibrio genomosp. F10 str. 9ZD137]
ALPIYTMIFLAKLVIAGSAMVAVLLWHLDDMSQWLMWAFSERVTMLVLAIAIGACVYIFALLALGIRLKDVKAATE